MESPKIEDINKRILSSIDRQSSVGLAHGKMGLCIYFFLLSRKKEYILYRDEAEKMLEDIYEVLSHNTSKDIESGLAGIALGIRYLIQEGFVEGDVNDVLTDIDNNIYTYLVNIKEQINISLSNFQIIQLLLYYSIRMDDLESNSDNFFIFTELIIILTNIFDNKNFTFLFREECCFTLYNYNLPLCLFVFSRLLNQRIYEYKIKNMLKSMMPLIRAHIPVSGANKLFLLTGLLHLSQVYPCEDLHKYMLSIKQKIAVNDIINRELKNQEIFFSNGILSIYLLLRTIENKYPEWTIHYDKTIFYDRLQKSEAWTSLQKKSFFFDIHRGLFNGITGVILMLDRIKNDIENEKP